VAVTTVACTHSSVKTPESPARAITSFSAAEWEQDLYRIDHEDLAHATAARIAGLQHLRDTNPYTRFAALYTVALTAVPGPTMQALRTAVRASDTSERLLAAVALLVRGEKAAIPVLIETLDSSQYLEFHDPPQQAWDYARSILLTYTTQDFGLRKASTLAAARRAQRAWIAWWKAHASSIHWDATSHQYSG